MGASVSKKARMEDLKVEIPKKYKKDLISRFNVDNAVYEEKYDEWNIEIKCPLCTDYKCDVCPFNKLSDKETEGCMKWIKKVLWRRTTFIIYDFGIKWCGKRDKEVRKQMKRLRDKAKKLIKWV